MNKKGILAGIASGMFWGLDGVLIIFALQMATTSHPGWSLGIIGIAGILACLKESIMLILVSLIQCFRRDWKHTIKNLAIRENRQALIFMVLAGICAGPIGMTAYALGAAYAGSAPAAVISAIYPVLAALGARFFLKDRIRPAGWLGILLVTAAVVSIVAQSGGDIGGSQFLLGIICAFIAALGWGSESVLLEYGLRQSTWSSTQCVLIRQIVSVLVYFAIVIPFFTAGSGFAFLTTIFTNQNLLIFIGLLGLNMTLSYMLYYYAIDTLQAVPATSLNVTYVLFASLWTTILLSQNLSITFWIAAGFTIIGIILVLRNVQPKKTT